MEGRYKQISQSLVKCMFEELIREGGFLFIEEILLFDWRGCGMITMKKLETNLEKKIIKAVYVKVGEKIGSFVTEKPMSKNMIIDFIKLQRQE